MINLNTIIKNFYSSQLKTHLRFLNIFNKNDKDYIISIYDNSNLNFLNYNNNIKKIIIYSIDKLSDKELINKIKLFFFKFLFIFINKNKYISPFIIKELPINILRDSFKRIIYDCIITTYYNCEKKIKNLNFFFNENNNLKLLEKNYEFIKVFNEIKNNHFHIFFLNFYIYILNKYNKNFNIIFPIYNNKHNVILASHILKNNHGGNKDIKILNLKEKLNNIIKTEENDDIIIKNNYNESELDSIENVLNNKKINNLISNKHIKLSKNFQNLLKDLINNENDLDDDKKKEIFNKIFYIDNNSMSSNSDNIESNIDSNKLYELYSNYPNKENFINYLIEKIIQNNYSKSINSNYMILNDKIINNIINHDFSDNSFNFNDTDIKFILILELLDTLKNNISSSDNNNYNNNEKSNITINLFKDNIKNVKIEDKNINFDS